MIRQLSPDAVARLAAGEIIHSFQQAIKELVENAVDAGAKQVQIAIMDKRIVVSNDNSAISREDHNLLCMRFCTSKLSRFEDLQNVQTHGFRGEALAAMSYVGTVRCTSGGFRSVHSCGKMNECDPVVIDDKETVFDVTFHELECEKGVLKTVEALTCIYYGIEFSIKTPTVTSRIEPRNTFAAAVERYLQAKAECVAISGEGYKASVFFCYSPKPSLCIVNQRYLPLQAITQAVQRLAQATEKSQRQIGVCLCATISPGLIDVNCHPQKLKIIITCENAILEALEEKFLAFIKGKAETLAPVTPVKGRKEVYQASPLRLLRQTANAQTLASQTLEQAHLRQQMHRLHRGFPEVRRCEYQPLGAVEVIGYLSGELVLFQNDLEICEISFGNVHGLLRNLLADFLRSGLCSLNPFVKCGVRDAAAAPMLNQLIINPLALFKRPKLQSFYQQHKEALMPRLTDLSVYGSDLEAWLRLFAAKLFRAVKDDNNLLFEVIRDCNSADASVVIEQSALLKMFNRM